MTNQQTLRRLARRAVSAVASLLPGPPSDDPSSPDADGRHGRDQLTAEDRLRISAHRKDGHGGHN